jgi:hypothetical protein
VEYCCEGNGAVEAVEVRQHCQSKSSRKHLPASSHSARGAEISNSAYVLPLRIVPLSAYVQHAISPRVTSRLAVNIASAKSKPIARSQKRWFELDSATLKARRRVQLLLLNNHLLVALEKKARNDVVGQQEGIQYGIPIVQEPGDDCSEAK